MTRISRTTKPDGVSIVGFLHTKPYISEQVALPVGLLLASPGCIGVNSKTLSMMYETRHQWRNGGCVIDY